MKIDSLDANKGDKKTKQGIKWEEIIAGRQKPSSQKAAMKQWFPDGGGSCKHEHPHLADLKERVGGEEVDMKGGGG